VFRKVAGTRFFYIQKEKRIILRQKKKGNLSVLDRIASVKKRSQHEAKTSKTNKTSYFETILLDSLVKVSIWADNVLSKPLKPAKTT